jgi:predicted PurR-regulated permease PerM
MNTAPRQPLRFVAGALLFGIVGLIIAVPVALTIKVTLAALYDEESNQEM